MLFENEQKKYQDLILAIEQHATKDEIIAKVDELVNAFMPFYDGMIFPVDEFCNDNYLVRRNAFVNSYDCCVNYGYTLYKWDGEYEETNERMKKFLPDFKPKKWREIFHCCSAKKQKLNQEWIDETLKLLNLLHDKHKTNEEN